MSSKCKVVHIGVFFDGTGNHKSNDTKKGKESNIAKLSELYRTGWLEDLSSDTCDYYGDMIYKEGVGTSGGKWDAITGGAAGSGGAKRINEAIDALVYLLDWTYPHRAKQGEDTYRDRVIDVFGFSRGAAMARDFINTFNKRNIRRFKLSNIRFNFVGLYDTVGSFGEAGNNINVKPKDPTQKSESEYMLNDENFFEYKTKVAYNEQEAENIQQNMANVSGDENQWDLISTTTKPNGAFPWELKFRRVIKDFEMYNFSLASYSAKKIVHFVASDEFRKNFPLTNIANSGGEELIYAGVHSDIGGGYEPIEKEVHKIDIQRLSQKDAIALKEKIIQKDPDIKVYIESTPLTAGYDDPFGYRVISESWSREVSNKLSLITLHRMHEIAKAHGVPFADITKQTQHSIPDFLQEYNKHTKASYRQAMEYEEIKALRKHHFHRSAVDTLDSYNYREGNDMSEYIANRMRYNQYKEPSREVFNNNPIEAIKPLTSQGA